MILALLPFLVLGQMPLMVMRAMRAWGIPVAIATYHPTPKHYTGDAAADFDGDDMLLDMRCHIAPADSAMLEDIVDRIGARMIVQAGAPAAYAQLVRLRERRPDIRQMDWIFNTGPHFRRLSDRPASFDTVLVESAVVREKLEAIPGMGRVVQVPSGIDLERFRPGGRALLAPSGQLVIGYVGRLSEEKNPLGFLDLAERLHPLMPTLRFSIHGEGPQAEAVKARIAASPAQGVIAYRGFAAHPTDAFATIDVLVLPSILDGRPAIVMEANACGIPVIGTPVGGIPEMIAEGRNGLVATLRDTTRIAAALAAWQASPEALAAIRSSSRSVAEANFDRRAMLDRYEAAFRATLSAPARPPAVIA